MGFRRWLSERLYKPGPSPEAPKEEKAEKVEKVKGYELWAKAYKGKWLKVQDLEEPVDFDDFEDPEPGTAYRLSVRYESGKYRQLWYRYVEGPKEREVVNPIAAIREILAPMKELGESMTGLKEDIQAAFGWALPSPTQGGTTTTGVQYKGEVPIMLHPAVAEGFKAWTPIFRDGAKEIGTGLREGFFGGGGEEKPVGEKGVTFSKPPPRPEDFAGHEQAAKEAS